MRGLENSSSHRTLDTNSNSLPFACRDRLLSLGPLSTAGTIGFTPLSGPPWPIGVQGLTRPSCYYMPSPPYTEEARSAKSSGVVNVQGIIGSDGLVKAVRVVKGAPYSLNESVLKTVRTWKCTPAMLDGKPGANDSSV